MSIVHFFVSVVAIIIAGFIASALGADIGFTLFGAVLFAAVFGIINMFLKPILSVLTLPINVLTLGIFSIILNTLLLLLAAAIAPGFAFGGFWSALGFSIVLAFVNILFNRE